jgi:hypothetical protein
MSAPANAATKSVRQGVRMGSIHWWLQRSRALCFLFLVTIIAAGPLAWSQAEPASRDLTADQVVQRLMEKNRERAAALVHYTAKRTYHLEYRGFPSSTDAAMEVDVNFDAPASKQFTIVSATGSKVIENRVFRRLLESEQQAADSSNRAKSELSPDNYNFSLAGADDSNYILNAEPKVESKFLYRGKIWVDKHDFAVTQIEAQPARNPSFWTTKALIHHTYQKLDNGLYLPKENKTITSVRLGGTATLTIEYVSYHVTMAKPVASDRKPVRAASSFAWPEGGFSAPIAEFASAGR